MNHMFKNKNLILILAASAIVFCAGALWNWFEPLDDYWYRVVDDLLTALPGAAAATASILLLRQFGPKEKPHAIWFWFCMGWCIWAAAEVIGVAYDVFQLPVADLSIFDFFWTAGYLCFGLSLLFQFRGILSPQKRSGLWHYLPVVALTLLATLGLTQWARSAGLGEGKTWFVLYLSIFYPVCDMAAGLAALLLAFLFGRGRWGRPWWGLISFAIADGLNIYLWIGGSNLLSESTTGFLYWLSTMFYNAGYLIVMFGILYILFLNFRPVPPEAGTSNGQMA
jgi:hypothetical protein